MSLSDEHARRWMPWRNHCNSHTTSRSIYWLWYFHYQQNTEKNPFYGG